MKSVALFSILLCSHLPQTKIDTTDWKTFKGKAGAFSIKAPKTWSKADPNDENTKAAYELIKTNNPGLAKMMEDGQTSDFDLFLIDLKSDVGPGINNINVKLIPGVEIGEELYDQVASALESQAKMEHFGHKTVSLPAGKAMNYWGDLTAEVDASTKVTFQINGYLMAKGGNSYVTTMTSLKSSKDQRAVYEEMAKTISIK